MDRRLATLLLVLTLGPLAWGARAVLGLDPDALPFLVAASQHPIAWRAAALLLVGLLAAGAVGWWWQKMLGFINLDWILAGAGLCWLIGLGSLMASGLWPGGQVSWAPVAAADAVCPTGLTTAWLLPQPAPVFLLLTAAGITIYLASNREKMMWLGLGGLMGGTAGLYGVAGQALSILNPAPCEPAGFALARWTPGINDLLASTGLMFLLGGIVYLGLAWRARQARPWFDRPAELTDQIATALETATEPQDHAASLILRGLATEKRDEPAAAEQAYTQALDLYRSLGHTNGQWVALTRLATLATNTGKPAQAQTWRDQAALLPQGEVPDVEAELFATASEPLA